MRSLRTGHAAHGQGALPVHGGLVAVLCRQILGAAGQPATPAEIISISIESRGSGEEAIEGVPKEAYGSVVLSFEPV